MFRGAQKKNRAGIHKSPQLPFSPHKFDVYPNCPHTRTHAHTLKYTSNLPGGFTRMATWEQTPAGTYRFQVCKLGVRDSRTFVSKAEGKAWAAARELEILRAGGDRRGKGKTLHSAIARFMSDEWPKRGGQRNEKIRLERIKREIPDVDILKLGPEHISAWRDRRLKKVKGASVRRDMNLLKTVLETARRDWGWIGANPMADVKRPPPSPNRTRTILDCEVQAIVAWSEWQEGTRPTTQMQRMAVALLIALETGMRASEIGRAVVSGRVARLENTKNGDARDVPLSKRAVELYALYEPIAVSAIDTSFRHCRDSCGLNGFVFHDSRHTACTRLAKKLLPMDLAKMLGHRDLKSTMVYYNPTADDLADRLD